MPRIECWKDVAGYKGLYRVSDLGRVKSLPRATTSGKVLKLRANCKSGRLTVTLSKGGAQTVRYVSHLVLEAFAGSRPDGTEACHFPDRSIANNCASNLRWGTRRDNYQDSVKHGTNFNRDLHPCGVKNGRAKLTEKDVLEMRRLFATGKYRKIDLCRMFGIGISAGWAAIDGTHWSHI